MIRALAADLAEDLAGRAAWWENRADLIDEEYYGAKTTVAALTRFRGALIRLAEAAVRALAR